MSSAQLCSAWFLGCKKKLFWEPAQISLHETIHVFCSNAASRFGCAGCRKLRLIMGFNSCIWDIQYKLLKKQFFIFWKRGLRRFGLCTFFWRLLYKSLENVGQCQQNQLTFVLKWRRGRPKVFALSCDWLFSLVVNGNVLWEVREVYVRDLIPIFVRLQCWVLPALVFEGYVWYFGSLHPAFEMSCDTENLKKQLLIFSETWSPSFCFMCNCFDDFCTNLPKNFGRFHRRQNTKFPRRRWVRSENVFFIAAPLFSLVLTKERCFENFLRSLYLVQYVFFFQKQSHVSAAPVLEGYLWYFGSLHLAIEMSCDIEYL